MATADRMTPETGKGIVLVLSVSGKLPCARQAGQNLRRADRVTFGVPVSISEELPEHVLSGRELRTMSLSPKDVLLDRLA